MSNTTACCPLVSTREAVLAMAEPDDVPLSRQEEYWDKWQEERSENPWAQRRSRLILELLESLQLTNAKILDLGCGNGWFCSALAEHGEVTGIDLSRTNMELAQRRFPHIRFIGANLFEYRLPEKHFDVVVSQQVVAHVSDQPEYIERCAATLKDGGHLILSTNNKVVMDRLGEEYVDEKALGHIENWLSFADLKRLLDRHFEIRSRHSIVPRGHCGFLRVVNSVRLNRVLSLFIARRWLEQAKEKAGLGYINLVLARKR